MNTLVNAHRTSAKRRRSCVVAAIQSLADLPQCRERWQSCLPSGHAFGQPDCTAFGKMPRLQGGKYERRPVENDWHTGSLSVTSDTELHWVNLAGASWDFAHVERLSQTIGRAVFPAGAPYAGTVVTLRLDAASGAVISFIGAGGEEYIRVGTLPAPIALAHAAVVANSTTDSSAAFVASVMMRPGPVELPGEFEAREAARAAEEAACHATFDRRQSLVWGGYERRPVENDWHVGSLQQEAPGTLRWTNRAGASWMIEEFRRTSAVAATGVFPPGAPYAGTVVQLVINPDTGAVASFVGAGAERYIRCTDEGGAPVAPAAAPAGAGAPTALQLPELANGLHGYVSMSTPPPPPAFSLGAGYYVPCWPLTAHTLKGFQIGLPGMWVTPENSTIEYPLLPKGTMARDNWPECAPSYRDHFQTIEGSMGFWTSTQFNTATAKYALNGTGDGYTKMLSSPGWSFSAQPLPPGKMGIVQLSNRLLVVPDGMPFRTGVCGPLFGTAWTALPLGQPTPAHGDEPPTGEQAWTLFLASETFKGPVVFWLPQYWSAIGRGYPPAHGRTLDTRPCKATGGAMEAAATPCFVAHEGADAASSAAGGAGAVADGGAGEGGARTFVRVPQLRFPVGADGWTDMMIDFVQLGPSAIASPVRAWLAGEAAFPSGQFARDGIHEPQCETGGAGLGFDIAAGGPESARRKVAGLDAIVQRRARPGCKNSFGLQWSPAAVAAGAVGGLIGLPDVYWRAPATAAGGSAGDKDVYLPASHAEAPRALRDAAFARKLARDGQAYYTPTEPSSCWRSPGPAAGPFSSRLADGSIAEYCWYRFDQQPTLVARSAEVPASDMERMQRFAEAVHTHWPITGRDYMPPPSTGGRLAALDDGLIVEPPAGLEVGYVPIVTRQYYAAQ
jgi:hypothetical protein